MVGQETFAASIAQFKKDDLQEWQEALFLTKLGHNPIDQARLESKTSLFRRTFDCLPQLRFPKRRDPDRVRSVQQRAAGSSSEFRHSSVPNRKDEQWTSGPGGGTTDPLEKAPHIGNRRMSQQSLDLIDE
jgi:hypothetical protein